MVLLDNTSPPNLLMKFTSIPTPTPPLVLRTLYLDLSEALYTVFDKNLLQLIVPEMYFNYT